MLLYRSRSLKEVMFYSAFVCLFVCLSVCPSVCLSVCWQLHVKTHEQIFIKISRRKPPLNFKSIQIWSPNPDYKLQLIGRNYTNCCEHRHKRLAWITNKQQNSKITAIKQRVHLILFFLHLLHTKLFQHLSLVSNTASNIVIYAVF